MLILDCEVVQWLILEHWQVDWYVRAVVGAEPEVDRHRRRVGQRLFVLDVARADGVAARAVAHVAAGAHVRVHRLWRNVLGAQQLLGVDVHVDVPLQLRVRIDDPLE